MLRNPESRTVAAWAATFLLAGAALLMPFAAAEDAPAAPYVVHFHEMPEGLSEGAEYQGGKVLRVDEALRFAVIQPAKASGAMSLLSADGVESVEPDAAQQWVDVAVGDPLLPKQYGPQQVRAPEAWATTTGSKDATVCVVDTGVRYTHEEFQDGRYLGGHDFVNRDDDPMDDQGHGTHVAGIAAASHGNGKGISGIGEVGLFAVKVMDDQGRGSPSMIASGIRWCADHDADVITLSLGGSPSSSLRKAVVYATQKGSLLVAAAGNSGACEDCVEYPAAYPEVLAVTCTTPERAQCSFSSEGREADLAAPGHQIVSTWVASDSAYKSLSGTSMSAPHVAGVAALVKSRAPHLSNAQLATLLKQTAQDLGPRGPDDDFGAGLVDAKAALDAALGAPSVPPTQPPAQPPGNATPAPVPAPVPAPEPEPPTGDGNQPPVADAGPDVTTEPMRGFHRALVTLDGTASHDPDGKLATAFWHYEGRLVAAGLTAFIPMGPGEHTVTLIVRDNDGAVATDTVTVTVLPPA